jgi:hypothetical protein
MSRSLWDACAPTSKQPSQCSKLSFATAGDVLVLQNPSKSRQAKRLEESTDLLNDDTAICPNGARERANDKGALV